MDAEEKGLEHVMDDLYCIDCYKLFYDEKIYAAHLDKCREENRIEMPADAEGDMYFK